jgi:hypothetical protein
MSYKYTLVLPRASASEYGEYAEAFFEAVKSHVLKELEVFRSLRKYIGDLKARIDETENRIRNNEILIKSYQEKFDKMNTYFPVSAIVTFLVLIFSLKEPSLAILFFILLFITLYLYYQSSDAKNQIVKISEENRRLRALLSELHEKLKSAEADLAGFKLPKIRVEVYKMYVPVGFWEFDGHLLAISSYAEKVPVEVRVLPSGDEVARIAGDVARLDQFYRDLFLRRRLEGKSIVDALVRLNLWDRVVSSRSPERVIAEEVSSDVERLKGLLQEWRGFLPLVAPEEGNVRFFKEAISGSLSVAGRLASVVEESESLLSESFSLLEELRMASEVLSQVEDFTRESKEMLAVAEGYKDVFERFLEMTRYTIPLEPPVGALRRIYCKRCTDPAVEDIAGKLDLLRWIDVNILGGVSEDADIVVAPEKVRDEVKQLVGDIRLLILRHAPLLGLRELPESAEDAVKAYYDALRKYSVSLSGGDDWVRLSLDKLSGEATLVCERCGSRLTPENTYSFSSITLPYIKAYFALLYEYVEKLFSKSETIRLSVNSARLSKDQRKTALGIYENMVHEFESKREVIIHELEELKRYEQSLLTIMSLLGVSEAVLTSRER